MLVLEDSGSVQPTPVSVQVDGKTAKVSVPPAPDSTKEPTETPQVRKPSPSPVPEPNKEAKAAAVPAHPEAEKPPAVPQTSPQLQKVTKPVVNSEPSKDPLGSPSQTHNTGKFSPLLDRKLRNLKNNETSGNQREGAVTSPLALLMAAKERDRQRTTNSLSRENSAKKTEQLSASIQPSDSTPNSFIVTPRSSSSLSQTSQDDTQEKEKFPIPVEQPQTIQTLQKPSSPALVRDPKSLSPDVSGGDVGGQDAEQSISKPEPAQQDTSTEELNMPLLPPPPEFDDLEEVVEPPPSVPPPDPPKKAEPAPSASPLPPAHIPPPPPKPKTPTPPKAPPLVDTAVKPKPQAQVKPKVAAPQQPLSASQATLLSILQKKMLEMDHKMGPVKEAESSSDDWGSPQGDEENKVPVAPKVTAQSKNSPVVNKAATLDMRELEGKVMQKYQEANSAKSTTR